MCLLIGVMLKEEGSVEQLIQHYIKTGRSRLAGFLFDRSMNNLSSDVRRKIHLLLIEANYSSISEIIQRDILALLTEEGMLLLKNSEDDEDMKTRLSEMYKRISPTLIHHIVFLSPELQSFVLRPENLSEIEKYGFDVPENHFAEVLRKNSYERGTTPLQVAKRLFSFIGNWGGLAQDFALFATNDFNRQSFLYEIYYQKNDDNKMINFLNNNPSVKEEHFSYYLELLFRNQEYKTICETVNDNRELTTKDILLILYAKIISKEELLDVQNFNVS